MNIKQAMQLLKDNGHKQTDKRADMIAFFARIDKYITAKEVLEELKNRYDGLSFDTIYRNLSLFVELGILEETELIGEKHFRFCCQTSKHHHHFICLVCGKTKELFVCPMIDAEVNLQGYEVTGHKFEVYGKCVGCC